MSVEVNRTFCVLPFVQTVVRTNGSIGPCCHIQTEKKIQQTTIEEFWQSNQLTQMRTKMIDGKSKIPECSKCYTEENFRGQSMRTKSLNDYKFYNEKHYEQLLNHYDLKNTLFPERLELHLGNLCNLKCLTCNPKDSSSFLTENLALKISDDRQKDYQLSDEIIEKLIIDAQNRNIKILDLRGGESMLMPVIVNKLLSWPQDKADNLVLRIQTNCTVMSKDWEQIFKKFKKIEIMMSIDAWGPDNEYIRFPSNWHEIEKNVKIFTRLENAKTYINCTVSNLNFLLLPKLINWAKTENIYINWSQLTFPQIFHYTNLPEDLFAIGQSQLEQYNEILWTTEQQHNNQLWAMFCNIINLRDNYRKTSIFNILPEFKNHWIKT